MLRRLAKPSARLAEASKAISEITIYEASVDNDDRLESVSARASAGASPPLQHGEDAAPKGPRFPSPDQCD